MNQKPKIKSISYRLLVLWKAFIAYRSKHNSLSTVFITGFLECKLSGKTQIDWNIFRRDFSSSSFALKA